MPVRHASPEVDGPKLRELRKARGLTITDAAAQMGVSLSYLAHIERGSRPTVAPAMFNKICGFYGVERVYLLRRFDEDAA